MTAGATIRRSFNVILPLIGMGLLIFYSFCDTSCRYLKGDLLGMELQEKGIPEQGADIVNDKQSTSHDE